MKYIEAAQGLTAYECSGVIEEIKGSDRYKQNGEVNMFYTIYIYIYIFFFNFKLIIYFKQIVCAKDKV